MDEKFTVRPHPIIAEILSGFVTLVLLIVGCWQKDPRWFTTWWPRSLGVAEVAGVGLAAFALSWVMGTFLNTCRDIFEWLHDLCRPEHTWLNWEFVLTAKREDVQRLDDWYLAFYLLNGNHVAGVVLILLLTWIGLISFQQWAVWSIAAFGIINLVEAAFLRGELTKIMGLDLPHVGVYSRLALSDAVPGEVGVKAIRKIKKGAYIFEPDDERVVWIDAKRVSQLPAPLQRLYCDFGPFRAGKFGVPTSFNKLTLSWYLNEPGLSGKPANVGCDKEMRFFALSDIEAGDELLVVYSDYCEAPPDFCG